MIAGDAEIYALCAVMPGKQPKIQVHMLKNY